MPATRRQEPRLDHIGLAERNLDRLLTWISRVDAKAGFAFVVLTALATSLATRLPTFDMMSGLVASTALAAFTLFGASLWCLVVVALPRTRANGESLFFFGTIASKSIDQYRAGFQDLTTKQAVQDLLEQAHRNAEILSTKFRYLQLSYRYLYAAFPFWLIAILAILVT